MLTAVFHNSGKCLNIEVPTSTQNEIRTKTLISSLCSCTNECSVILLLYLLICTVSVSPLFPTEFRLTNYFRHSLLSMPIIFTHYLLNSLPQWSLFTLMIELARTVSFHHYCAAASITRPAYRFNRLQNSIDLLVIIFTSRTTKITEKWTATS
jgi:hypothetical protein